MTKICLGRIGAPHGIRGEVRVKSYTDDPLALGDYGILTDDSGRNYEVTDIRNSKNVVIVRFRHVTTREQAEALNGTDLFIDRQKLPDETLAEDEFFHEDLIGLQLQDTDGKHLGKVRALHDFGAGDLLEIHAAAGMATMIPFTMAAIPVVDLDRGIIIVEPVAAGLVSTGEEEDEQASGEQG